LKPFGLRLFHSPLCAWSMAQYHLSPRLAQLCADHTQLADTILSSGLRTTQDLGTLAEDADVAAAKLKVPDGLRATFAEVFAVAKGRASAESEERMHMPLDVLNNEGHLVMTRPRHEIHRQGFCHRGVNVWVICPSSERVLLGQRCMSKDHDPRKWTCVCGRVPAGELSYNAAVDKLADEFNIADGAQVDLMFSMKCQKRMTKGVFAGQTDSVWLDVYVAVLQAEVPVHRILLNVKAKQAASYVPLADLARSFEVQDPSYVHPPNEEYTKKLLHYLEKTCEGSTLRPHAKP